MAFKSMPLDDHRRKWDRDEYEKLADDRKRKEEEEEKDKLEGKRPSVKRELLRPRDYKVDLDSRLGRSTVITKTTALSNQGGYYCNVCDCVVKDSINFLDHVNGRKHQRNMGMSMRVERSTLDQVKARFDKNKQKKEQATKTYDYEERMREIKEEEEKVKAYRKEKRKDRKRKSDTVLEDFGLDPEVEASMGFSGFGAAKKK